MTPESMRKVVDVMALFREAENRFVARWGMPVKMILATPDLRDAYIVQLAGRGNLERLQKEAEEAGEFGIRLEYNGIPVVLAYLGIPQVMAVGMLEAAYAQDPA